MSGPDTSSGSEDLVALAAAVGLDLPELRRADVEERVGLSHADMVRWWRAMGFAEVPEDEPAFGPEDVWMARALADLIASGRVEDRDVLRLARVLGASFSRIAEAQVALLEGADADDDGTTGTRARHDAELLALLERSLVYVWRRHLLAALGRRLRVAELAGEDGPDRTDDHGSDDHGTGDGDDRRDEDERDDGGPSTTTAPTATSTVGFVDIAGFSRLSRRLDPDELTDLVDAFEAAALDAVADHDGRVVKFIGDAVMYVAPDLGAGVRIGLDLQARAVASDLPAELHCGVASGPTVTMGGDVFGPTVNLASRLTDVARKGSVVVTRESAAALRDDPTLVVRNARRVYDLKGIGRTRVATVATASDDGDEAPARRRRS